jgi:UPF0176 protein
MTFVEFIMFEVLGFYKFLKIRSLKKNKVLLQDFLNNKKLEELLLLLARVLMELYLGKAKDIKSTIN